MSLPQVGTVLRRDVYQAFTDAMIVTRRRLLDRLHVPVLAHRAVDGLQVRQLVRRHAAVIDLLEARRLLEHCGLLGSRALDDSLWILGDLVDGLAAELRHGHLLWRQTIALYTWAALARLGCRRVHAILSQTTAFNAELVLLDGGG